MKKSREPIVFVLVAAGVIVASGILVVWLVHTVRFVTPVSREDRNMRAIQAAFLRYNRLSRGRLPKTLSELTSGPDALLDISFLVHPAFPVVPGSDPPSSYRYVPCEPTASSAKIILYPNAKPGTRHLIVLRYVHGTCSLAPEDYEKEIRALGEDYDSLPEPKWE